jgi:chromatin remodeling complex protein RSC6
MSLSKRVFTEIDEIIPDLIWEYFPEKAKKLQKIAALEDDVDNLLMGSMRTSYAMNSERSIKSKIMRIYLHHKFVPQVGDEKSHFLLTVEGQLLDNDYKYCVPFGSCFEKIRFVPDSGNKRQQQLALDRQTEWSETMFPDGLKASCFRCKIYGEKSSALKILLFRRSNIRPRYEVSSRLRMMIPYIRVDPTEDEVILAVWQYLISKNLFIEGKERKVIRCDDILRDITGVDSLLLSTLKTKLVDELSPCKPIQIDYNLTSIDSKLEDRYTSSHRSLSLSDS